MALSPAVIAAALMAVALIAAVLITQNVASRRERQVHAAFPALGRLVQVGDIKVHALIRGTGPDLVLIHGASGNLRDLLPLIDRLAQDHRVVAFDRPGLGWSDPIPQGATLRAQALVLAAAAAQLGVQDPLVVGQSYGGSVALAWALHAPLPPRALVLISAPSLPWPGALDPWYRLTDSFAAPLVIPLVAAFVPDSYLDRAVTDIFAPDAAPPDYLTYVGAGLSIRAQTLAVNAAQVNGLRAQIVAQAPAYPGLTLPVELIHGSADTIVPLAIHSAPLAQMLPRARLTVIDGAGHMPHHSHPDTVLAVINRAAAHSQLPWPPQRP